MQMFVFELEMNPACRRMLFCKAGKSFMAFGGEPNFFPCYFMADFMVPGRFGHGLYLMQSNILIMQTT